MSDCRYTIQGEFLCFKNENKVQKSIEYFNNPPGAGASYGKTCNNCKINKGVLTCGSCRKINQTNGQVTSINLKNCKKNSVKNIDGVLKC